MRGLPRMRTRMAQANGAARVGWKAQNAAARVDRECKTVRPYIKTLYNARCVQTLLE